MSFQDIDGTEDLPSRLVKKNNVADPSQAVAAGVFQMNTQVATFKRLVNTLGTLKDTPQVRERLHKVRQQLTELAKETGSKLKDAQEADHSDLASRTKKLSDAKLARDFQAVLREFQSAQKQAAERESQFGLPSSGDSRVGSFRANGDAQPRSQEQQPLTAEQKRQDLLLVENELVYNEAVMEEREQGIKEIQQQIGEVNEIFKDLAVLVKEQGEMIDDIEAHVEKSHTNTQLANRQLVGAVKKQKVGNTLTCWLVVVFAVAMLIFFLVMSS